MIGRSMDRPEVTAMLRFRLAAPGLALLLLAACASAPAPPPGSAPPPAAPAAPAPQAPPTPPAPPVAADDLLQATLWEQRAVEHDLIYDEVYRVAREKLLAALADPGWDALPHEERSGPVRGLAPAVILDVDETVLDNSGYQARLIRSGEEYNEFTWSKWCHEEIARALPGALEFTRFAAAHGVTVFYLTNRAQDLGDVTLANLEKEGFPVAGPEVFLGLGTVVAGCEQIGSDKGCRRRLIGEKYRVLMQFGDQVGDFVDVVSTTTEGRAQAMAPYAGWIGERWWVLPNPGYGSWEPAVFHNDWSQPRAARRKAKIEALREN
jgi:5'-nucleotidase (lipoprotein e(P4) family)